jgi:hypothetical protein
MTDQIIPIIGWAVVDEDGLIDIRTVSGSRRAAVVNYLCVSCGVIVLHNASDQHIDDLWREHGGQARIISVAVKPAVTRDDFGPAEARRLTDTTGAS